MSSTTNSYLKTLQLCHNATLPNSPFETNSNSPSTQPHLIPFFIHAPDSIPGASVLRLPPLPRRSSSRRTSSTGSTTQRPSVLKPLSSYLTRPDSSEDLSSVLAQLNQLDEQAGYSSTEQQRDFSLPIGFLRPDIVQAMLRDNEKMIEFRSRPCWKALYRLKSTGSHEQDSSAIELDLQPTSSPWCLAFEDWINHEEGRRSVRREHFDRLVRGWKESGQFLNLLAGWRDEEYAIYGPRVLQAASDSNEIINPGLPGSNIAFRLERAATGLFGFLTFGVHLTAYIIKDGAYHIWVPRRSPTKPTWPSMLDNTAAGGITAGESPTETIIRECFEEASLSEEIVIPRLKATGLISYVHRGSHGFVQPEVQYTYELQLPSDGSIVPQTNDGEATDFRLMNIDEVRQSIQAEEWKPNCAAVMVDFMVHHGLVTPENDDHYFQVCTELKQAMILPGPY